MRFVLLMRFAVLATPALVPLPRRSSVSRAAGVRMLFKRNENDKNENEKKLRRLRQTLAGLEADGYGEEMLLPLREEIQGLVTPTSAPAPPQAPAPPPQVPARSPPPPPRVPSRSPPPRASPTRDRAVNGDISFEEALRIAREADAKVNWGRPPLGSLPGEAEALAKEKEVTKEKERQAAKARADAAEAARAQAVEERMKGEAAAKQSALEAKRAADEAASKAAAQRAAVEQAALLEAATTALNIALRGVEFGRVECTPDEVRELKVALKAARGAGMAAADLARAEEIECAAEGLLGQKAAAEKAAAEAEASRRAEAEKAASEAAEAAARAAAKKAAAEAEAARRAEAEKAAAELAAAEAEATEAAACAECMVLAKEEIRRSVRLSGSERKKVLRSLQLEFHPDKQTGMSSVQRETATEITMLVNEAMMIAKKNAKARGETF